MSTIVWLRHDLRLADNAAFDFAVQRGGPVWPVFIAEPDGLWSPGGAARVWLHDSLAALAQELAAVGSRLIIRQGEALDVLRELKEETGATALAFNATGGVGCISVTGNIAPKLVAKMQAASLKGDGKTSWVQTPQQLQSLLDTGRSDALTQDLSNELLLINGENEALARGEVMIVMLDDDHTLHLKLHKAVTGNLASRKDPKVVAALQAHQDAHVNVLRNTDPAVLQALGQTPLAPAGMPPGAPGAPQMPPGEAPESKTAAMPTNPATNQQAAPAGGTMPPALAVRPS
jgi:hypothetical protein